MADQPESDDQSYLKHFPMAAAAGASRKAYQEKAQERRDEAVRAANLELAQQQAQDDAAKKDGQPVPTGAGENPHEDEPAVDPTGKEPEKHSGDDPLTRQQGKKP